MEPVELLVKEYDTLRQEILDSMTNRSQIVSFGLATIGILFAGILAGDRASENRLLLLLVFCVAVPIACVLALYMWLGEVERMMRAGGFLVKLEERINQLVDSGSPTLTWESQLRSGGNQMKYPYIVVVALFLGFAVGSPVLGIVAGALPVRSYWWALVVPWVIELSVAWHVRQRSNRFGVDPLPTPPPPPAPRARA